MRRFPLISAILACSALWAGCSDDPAPKAFGPGSGADPTSPDGGGAVGADGGTVAKDAAVDQDPGYRDPNKIDGGCSLPNLVCNGVCVDVSNDENNCGKCGVQCTGPGATCQAGRCGCTGPLFDYCDGVGCMDVSSDVNNCGKCGNVCDPNNFNDCNAGVCVQNC